MAGSISTREAFRVFLKHLIEFGIDESIIEGVKREDIDKIVNELEDDPDFHKNLADLLNEELMYNDNF